MDIQSAIENLKRARELYLKDFGERADAIDFYDTIISAMQELQQYHGLCKPEEIEHLKSLVRIIRCHGTIGKVLEAYAKYEEAGTLEEVRVAVEKQKAKKPLLGGNTDKFAGDIRICPYCSGIVGIDDVRADFCADCGQHIDWSEEE